MIFLGYDFLRDKYCWQPTPTDFTNINNIRIENVSFHSLSRNFKFTNL